MDAKFGSTINRISRSRCSQPDMVALVFSQSDRLPGRALLYRAATRPWQQVLSFMPGVQPKADGRG